MNLPQVAWARVHENQVTHLVKCTADWTVLNTWPDIPGVWVQANNSVQSGWQYDPNTGVFTPPDQGQ